MSLKNFFWAKKKKNFLYQNFRGYSKVKNFSKCGESVRRVLKHQSPQKNWILKRLPCVQGPKGRFLAILAKIDSLKGGLLIGHFFFMSRFGLYGQWDVCRDVFPAKNRGTWYTLLVPKSLTRPKKSIFGQKFLKMAKKSHFWKSLPSARHVIKKSNLLDPGGNVTMPIKLFWAKYLSLKKIFSWPKIQKTPKKWPFLAIFWHFSKKNFSKFYFSEAINK